MKPKDVLAFAKENKTEIVDLKFVDLPGLWQHFSITTSELNEDLFENGIGFDGSSIRGFQTINESDMNDAQLKNSHYSDGNNPVKDFAPCLI